MADAIKVALKAAAQMATAVKCSRSELAAEIQRQLAEHSGSDLAATLKLLPDAELGEAYHILCQLFEEVQVDGGDLGRKIVLAKIKWEVGQERSRRPGGSWPDRGGSKQDPLLASMAASAPALVSGASPVESVISAEPLAASAAPAGVAMQFASTEVVARLTTPQAADLTPFQRELAGRIRCKLGELSESEFVLEFKSLPNAEVTEWHHLLKLILEELVKESNGGQPDNPGGNLWLEDLMSRRRKAQAALKEYYELSVASLAPAAGRAAASRPVAGMATSQTPVEVTSTATASKAAAVKLASVQAIRNAATHAGVVRPGSASSPYRETREEAAQYVTKYNKLRYQCAQRLRQKYFSEDYDAEFKIGELVVRESCEDPVMNYLTGSEPDWPPSSGFQFLSRPKKRLNLKTEARRS